MILSSQRFFQKTNSTLTQFHLFLFVFRKKVKTPKRHFEINWPLTPVAINKWLQLWTSFSEAPVGISFSSKVKYSTIKKYFLPISRDSSYDAIFRCPETYSLNIKIFAFLKKNVMRLHASVFFLIVAINFNYLITAASHIRSCNSFYYVISCNEFFTNTNNGLPVKLHLGILKELGINMW